MLLVLNPLYAKDKNYLADKNGCYILYDVSQNKMIKTNNTKHCSERFAPYSSFKVPLSVMGFDNKVMTQKTIFPWDGESRFKPEWNQDQTPKTYLQHSVLWVSYQITDKLGMKNIQDYLKKFQYGNQDFSGNPGKDDGLMTAWRGTSLKISAKEQLNFLNKFLKYQLPVSKNAIDNTKENMFLDLTANGNKFYGKTGSSEKQFGQGWFIGFVEKKKLPYIIIVNFTDKKPNPNNEYGGPRAKAIAKEILSDNGF